VYYESTDDVRLRLQRSIVAYKGAPVHVDEALSKTVVQVTSILTGDTFKALVKDLDLRPSSLPLGYVTVEDKVYLTSRKPCRKYKQGLTQENFHYREVLGKAGLAPRGGLSVTNRAVARTMTGVFADIGEAFSDVRKGVKKVVPFSREWAVADCEDELCLMYRGEVVGYAGDVSVRLLPERYYLKESLELCLK
jgi:hypothetical protein